MTLVTSNRAFLLRKVQGPAPSPAPLPLKFSDKPRKSLKY